MRTRFTKLYFWSWIYFKLQNQYWCDLVWIYIFFALVPEYICCDFTIMFVLYYILIITKLFKFKFNLKLFISLSLLVNNRNYEPFDFKVVDGFKKKYF